MNDKYYAIQVGPLTIGVLLADQVTYDLFYGALGGQGYELLEISEERCAQLIGSGERLFQQRSGE